MRKSGDGKRRLMEAAGEAFGHLGFDQVGVAQILEGAGVQAPTLYHHYGDKEGLYVAWACLELGAVEPKFLEAAAAGDVVSALTKVAGGIATLTFDLRQMLKDSDRLQKSENREKLIAAYLQALYDPLYSTLVRARTRGELKNEPLAMLAEVFIAGAMAAGRSGRRDAPEDAAGWWARMFLFGSRV